MINVDVNILLPQKQPFVMVDALLDYSETEIKAGLTVTEQNLFTVNGSFLEAGLIEHMAQSVALHTGYGYYLKNEEPPKGYIGSISEVKVLKLPKIGDVIESEVKIIQEFMGITLVSVNSFINGEIVALGKMKTVLAS